MNCPVCGESMTIRRCLYCGYVVCLPDATGDTGEDDPIEDYPYGPTEEE